MVMSNKEGIPFTDKSFEVAMQISARFNAAYSNPNEAFEFYMHPPLSERV